MIFVTTGHKEFDRLIKKMDFIAKHINREVVMQIGYKPIYFPQNGEYYQFIQRKEYDVYFQNAELIISHCSIGVLLKGQKYHKPIIMVPRQHALNELVDDHQLDFAQMIKSKNLHGITVVFEMDDLEEAISNLHNFDNVPQKQQEPVKLIKTIRNFVRSCDKNEPRT